MEVDSVERWAAAEPTSVGEIEAAAVRAIRAGIGADDRARIAGELEEVLALRARLRDRLEDLRRGGREGLRSVEGERKVRRAYAGSAPEKTDESG